MSAVAQFDLFGHLVDSLPTQAPDLGLRHYQATARANVAEVFTRTRSALVSHATGLGKTRLAGAVAWDFKLRGLKTLFLAPTIEITHQSYEAMRKLGLSATIEQASNRASRPLPDVTVACIATMQGLRLQSFRPDDFGLVVADECHAAIADRYRAVFAHLASAKLLGISATPDRTDGLSLANVFDELAHEFTMLQGIQEGFLAPLRFKTAVTDFDAKALRTLAGDVSAGSVEAEITRSGLVHEAANTLAELAEGERTVAFLPTVASSKAFVAELIARGVPAVHIDGTTPSDLRKQYFAQTKSGQVRVISNVGCLVEGFDLPEVSVIALLNPTKSRSRLTQMIGRGTRLAPGKESCLVIDFCPGRLKKGRLASPADALAGRMLPDDVYQHIPASGELVEAVAGAERAAAEIEEQKRQSEAAARKRAERVAELAALARKRAFTYGVQDHDAGSILGGQGGADRGYSSGGVDVEEAERRRSAGLCSPKQAKQLARHGLNPDMKWRLAREAMDAIANNGWKLPDEIKNDRRFYAKGAFPGDLAERALEQLKGGK